MPPSGRQLTLPAEGEAVIGRLDATRGVFPNIDLTPEGGLEGGVSRRHARIHRQKSQYFIEDLGSANGTFLNGQRLTPYLPHPLHDGDELQLGRVRIRVAVKYARQAFAARNYAYALHSTDSHRRRSDDVGDTEQIAQSRPTARSP